MFISNYSQFRESTRDDASKAQLRPISLSFIHAIIDSLKYEKRANIYWKDSPWKNENPHMIHQKQKNEPFSNRVAAAPPFCIKDMVIVFSPSPGAETK